MAHETKQHRSCHIGPRYLLEFSGNDLSGTGKPFHNRKDLRPGRKLEGFYLDDSTYSMPQPFVPSQNLPAWLGTNPASLDCACSKHEDFVKILSR
jgi:hypothetical protein